MAFCTSCGASLEGASKFCTKCGAAVAGAASAATSAASGAAVQPARAAAQPAAASSGSSAVKIILVVVAVIVGLAVLGGAVIGFGVWRLARRSHIEAGKERARIETPFGTVESGDAAQTVKNLGVDVYPGARPLPGSAAVSFGGMSTAAAEFETPDSPDLVEAFYKARFPRSTVNVSDQNQRTLVFATNKGMITIVIEPRGNMTRIQISNVGGTKTAPSEPQPN